MGRKGKGSCKGRGGGRQRLEAERAELDDRLEETTSPGGGEIQLAIALLYLWSLGTLSPQMVQWLANIAANDIRTINMRNKVRHAIPDVDFEEFQN